MKKLPLLTIITSCALLFSKCCVLAPQNANCCNGYTGTTTEKHAVALLAKDHFMPKDTILAWTAKYQANKTLICHDSLPTIGKVLGDSCSFNRCIIKAIICNDSCIGLRVIYGMDPNFRVHVILVGIKPDYSTLYIDKSAIVCDSNSNTMARLMSEEGGAEYGMEP